VDTQLRKSRVAILSVVSNTALVAGKLIIGLLIGSVSVISEAIHSAVDLVAAVIALFSVRRSGLPADADHPFGHGKIENISGTVEALLIFLAAGWIIFEAVEKLKTPAHLEDTGWGIAVMSVSAAVNIVVSRMLFKVGRETDSVALLADAWHLRTDVYTSIGVMGGLLVIWVGKWKAPQLRLEWVDPAAALVVAAIIVRAAWHLTVQSVRDLLDVKLPDEEEREIKRIIQEHFPTIKGFHQFRTRKSGNTRHVDFHIKVDRQMTLESSHALSKDVSQGIKHRFPHTTVVVHIEPCLGECEKRCVEGCLLTEESRGKISKVKERAG
jgi:cation diffusion facilitator family transporter